MTPGPSLQQCCAQTLVHVVLTLSRKENVREEGSEDELCILVLQIPSRSENSVHSDALTCTWQAQKNRGAQIVTHSRSMTGLRSGFFFFFFLNTASCFLVYLF